VVDGPSTTFEEGGVGPLDRELPFVKAILFAVMGI
jgi:hypothetical protein